MVDNVTLNPSSGGAPIRALARQGGAVETQVVQLDLGGASANAEVLITAGQKAMSASVPVVLAIDQTLPVGSATAALQTTGNASLASAVTALGAHVMQASGSSVTANIGTLGGAASSANQLAPQGAIGGGTAATASVAVGGIYRTNPPTLTSGQQAATNIDVNGNLQVNVQQMPGDVAASSINITVNDAASSSATGQGSQTIYSGTPTINSTAKFLLGSAQTVTFRISGVWTAATGIQTEVSMDGAAWVAVKAFTPGGSPTTVSLFTSNVGVAAINTGGMTAIRFRALGAWTGTATVLINESGTLGAYA